MSKWDREYIKLCKKILKEGKEVSNRTGINTIKIPSYNLHFNLEEEFPVLQTKQLFFRQAILEILWIYQAQSNDVRWLQERNVRIWDDWMCDSNGVYKTTYYEIDKDGNTLKKEIKKELGKEFAHTIGTAYGYIVNRYKLIDKLLYTIKNNPTDRRMVISLWQNEFLDTATLPSCVWSSEWDVTDGRLNLLVHQRSCDVPLGLPFNVTQYATLLSLIAKECNLIPGTIDWSIKDAQIYVNQVDMIKEQIKRLKDLDEFTKDKPKPSLWLNPNVKNFYDYDNSKDCKDIKIENYTHMGKITFEKAAK